MLGDFADRKRWSLVNEFTIRETRENSDRPLLHTRVPNNLHAQLAELRAVHSLDWKSSYPIDDETSERDRGYNRFCRITCKATLEDQITVFSLEQGVASSFEEIREVNIKPISKGRIGGSRAANASDGIHFSGMSAREVPSNGLMDGEPGELYFFDHRDNEFVDPEERIRFLMADVFLEEDQFFELFDRVASRPEVVLSANLTLVAELFQNEMEASLSEPWMTQYYGMLLKGGQQANDFAVTRARIDHLSVTFGKTKQLPAHTSLEDEAIARDDGPLAPKFDSEPDSGGTVLGKWSNADLGAGISSISRSLLMANVLLFLLVILVFAGQ